MNHTLITISVALTFASLTCSAITLAAVPLTVPTLGVLLGLTAFAVAMEARTSA